MAEGRIMTSIGGFYDVEDETGRYQCRARGRFRKDNVKPIVGDWVSFSKDGAYITEVHERDNMLLRPPVANVDQAYIICAAKDPDFSSYFLDRVLVHAEAEDIEPVIVITKLDQVSDDDLELLNVYKRLYEDVGYDVYFTRLLEEGPPPALTAELDQRITVLSGPSGAGKSTLLNVLAPEAQVETGEVSAQLGRGRHTTRHVELWNVNGGRIADTPGFSSLEFHGIEAKDLTLYFPEMRERLPDCKFRGCAHKNEPGCAVKAAVSEGEVAEERYQHYLSFYDEIQSRRLY
ncbi:ribosome biogenesis GTPase [Salsuginibacillus halophilus]|uniref:Small ribosomal subunit biogenesis GTPase RsgA n=1 Tax=Salsuginibacillus halophilus TaxID=517424 RepID=A0A2P8HYA1_9BACI|nr:ribosome small subunit-dependent GTPase A [Salsuginibacillus halophilus]PSL51145.1 ribosome biogenesis GTPase [Salsuginibacillus halophilus]